MPLYSEGRR